MRKKDKKISLVVLREAKGLSQRALAKETGVSASAIASYETGSRKPGLTNALALSKFFGVNLQQIQYGPSAK